MGFGKVAGLTEQSPYKAPANMVATIWRLPVRELNDGVWLNPFVTVLDRFRQSERPSDSGWHAGLHWDRTRITAWVRAIFDTIPSVTELIDAWSWQMMPEWRIAATASMS